MTIEDDEQLKPLEPGLVGPPEEDPRIYLACPLTNLDRDQRLAMQSHVDNVKHRIDQMTFGDRINGEGWLVSVYAPIEHSAPWGDGDGLSPHEVYQRNLTELLDSDALSSSRPGLPAPESGRRSSGPHGPRCRSCTYTAATRSAARSPASRAAVTVQPYGEDFSLLGTKVGYFLQHQRRAICDGPRRRASKRLRFAFLTQQLQLAWARAANRTELAANCGLQIPMIDSMLADSARVATMPVDALTVLCTELGIVPFGAGRQLSVPDMRALMAAADQFGWDDALLETVRARGLEILGADPDPRLDTPDRWRALLPPVHYS